MLFLLTCASKAPDLAPAKVRYRGASSVQLSRYLQLIRKLIKHPRNTPATSAHHQCLVPEQLTCAVSGLTVSVWNCRHLRLPTAATSRSDVSLHSGDLWCLLWPIGLLDHLSDLHVTAASLSATMRFYVSQVQRIPPVHFCDNKVTRDLPFLPLI